MDLNSDLVLCTYNCHGLKSSINEIKLLCNECNILVLQEHWLLPVELSLLSSIHSDFLSTGNSAVNISNDILIGRPYGGTAILFNKAISPLVSILQSPDPRLTLMSINSNLGPILLVCVYMPTDYGNGDCFDEYVELCSTITAIYYDSNAVQLIVAGDFNCQIGSRFFPILKNFANDLNLILTDISRLCDVFTFSNSSNNCHSWIDHVVCSRAIDDVVINCEIKYNYITSDHKPLFVTFKDLIVVANINNDKSNLVKPANLPDWSKADIASVNNYKQVLNDALKKVCIPKININNVDIENKEILDNIDIYYNDIINCIKFASEKCIPVKHVVHSEYVIPGWNEYVKEKHTIARYAYNEWLQCGKPKYGFEYEEMYKSRAQFKYALRYCKNHDSEFRSNAYAEAIRKNDYASFWKSVAKSNNSSANKYAINIDGCIGDDNIAERWREYFCDLYNCHDNNASKQAFDNRLKLALSNVKDVTLSIDDVTTTCCNLKRGKSPGPDGISSEAILFGCPSLFNHIWMLFNLFLKFSYLPDNLITSAIIPLVKNKAGNLSDLNNYRAIAISNVFSKLFEYLLIDQVYSYSDYDYFQFGFKDSHSTGLCTNVLKRTIDYYRNYGSHVFTCFVDFNKAFDSVNYWKLFSKLLDDNINCKIVSIIAYWYCKQVCFVRWHNSVSSTFSIGNGTRQGGVLSPYLFSRYIRELIASVVDSGVGCKVNGITVNILAYADDIVLISPSWRALQALISILHDNAAAINLSCNISKTVAMVFKPRDKRWCISSSFPNFTMGSSSIEFVSSFKYLGHIITNNLKDDEDISREIRNTFVRANVLLRKFRYCSSIVKTLLFKSYCLCFYDIALWSSFNVSSINKFRSCYNRAAKIFFGFKRSDSLTYLLYNFSIPSFDTIMHNSKHIFQTCVLKCNNPLVKCFG